ncbi:MAG: hypothetical protein E3J94_02935 [Desulfobacteraceae bacterium]|nr:MAG: hypothetical protein E3J94_02935 [Desulfobacteraceae bacterium]
MPRGILAPLALGVEMPVSLWNASIYSTVAVLSLWGSMLHALCTILALLLGFGDSLRRYPMKLHRLTKRIWLFYFAPWNFVIAPWRRIFNRGRDYFTIPI